MKSTAFAKLLLSAAIVLCGMSAALHADGLNNNEVEFTGMISSVVVNGDGAGTIFIRLESFDLRVIVNSKTELRDQDGDGIRMSDLKTGLRVEITGKYSSSGILAARVRIINGSDSDFELRGHITSVQPSGSDLRVVILGLTVTVTSATNIEADGVAVPSSTLKTGLVVQAKGDISESTWMANSIKILSTDKKKERIRFEGTVAIIGKDSIQIAVEGLTASVTPVMLTQNTRVVGQLAEGVPVLVTGTLNTDLSVTASLIYVLPALEIKPDERKLKIGETAVFTVKLRETAATDTKVTLTSNDTAVLTLSATALTIPKGNKTADFSAAGNKIGTATITAEGLNQKATAFLKVGDVSENENERPAGNVHIAFAPEKLKMEPGETRDVVLLIKPPQKAPVTVEFKVTNGLVKVAGTRELGLGVAEHKVTIQAGSQEGTDSVVAILPATLGGGKAELLIDVSSKADDDGLSNPDVTFRPDELKMAVGEAGVANLVMDRSLDKDVTVDLVALGIGPIVDMPAKVTIPAGSKMVQVAIKGTAEGKSVIVASLPLSLGGDEAMLQVEVTGKGQKQKLEIAFRPGAVTVTAGESVTANLVLNRASDQDVTVNLLVSGPGSVVEVPSNLTVKANTTTAPLTLKGKAAGKVIVVASLPLARGVDDAKLTVQVKAKK